MHRSSSAPHQGTAPRSAPTIAPRGARTNRHRASPEIALVIKAERRSPRNCRQGTCGLEIADQALRSGSSPMLRWSGAAAGASPPAARVAGDLVPGLPSPPASPSATMTPPAPSWPRASADEARMPARSVTCSCRPCRASSPSISTRLLNGASARDADVERRRARRVRDLKLVVEPGGAAAPAAAPGRSPTRFPGNTAAVVLSGGNVHPHLDACILGGG